MLSRGRQLLLVPTVLHGLLAHSVFRAVVVLLALFLLAWVPGSAPASAEAPGDLALREVNGLVEQTLPWYGHRGEVWLEAVIDDGSSGSLRVRLAPMSAFERTGFELRRGDPIQVRFFVSDEPPAVQRIRNLRTGAVLRLRCPHGEPLWDRHRARGGGPKHTGRHPARTASAR
jgi:hypothetical protein